ncbi:hypothetical protein E1B28_009793 [Marasmius oreades]|uniref:Uncharacterized protein n=1 Tax=Marasmius oreades TaxID=181124 RepID=A0A9P7RVS9_9AGAR|nr:uncharacterized protein E1B28_009793 [Marasmius oreades]KAG7090699.1 hypothetical protein E1B28_009793 [Marasmius oreades]
MARQRDVLPRLNIPPPLNVQQPRGQPLFSPALPTSLQHSFHPPIPLMSNMQTPMQPYFNPQPPLAPARPTHASQATISHLPGVGIHPNGFPITPLAGHFARPSLALPNHKGLPSAGYPFPNRNRRQLSVGGPPKAVLGGPARKTSPLPSSSVSPQPAPLTKTTKKKTLVNLPKETIPGEEGQPPTRPPWARSLLDAPPLPPEVPVAPVEHITAEIYPSDQSRRTIPPTVDVFLPGKSAWDVMKQQHIEEKLEKLGVERGGNSVPQIHVPHARAASISSPADPALLLFKLNKLQQSQLKSANKSLTTSPQPPFLTPSPTFSAPQFITNRHGHSLSLSQPPTHLGVHSNPFGPHATLGSDQNTTVQSSPRFSPAPESVRSDSIFAPQGRVPVVMSSLVPPPLSAVRRESNPDFSRGFGLDIPEENEEEAEAEAAEEQRRAEENAEKSGDNDEDSGTAEGGAVLTVEMEQAEEEGYPESDKENDGNRPPDGLLTASQSRHHSRHVSRLSAALSLRSFGGLVAEGLNERIDGLRDEISPSQDVELESGVEEWTGSEDADGLMGGNLSDDDDESIGEWSNPSDEERARQQRADRRYRAQHLAVESEQPRRLPKFPRPPDNTVYLSMREDQDEEDIISNPSEEGHHEYLNIHGHFHDPSSNSSKSTRPLPPLPHSRGPSGHVSVHDPALAHSRQPSDVSGSARVSRPSNSLNLNPLAKPFVFGSSLPREPTTDHIWRPDLSQPSTAPMMAHSRLPSLSSKPLNAAAQEFKPGSGGFTFRFPAPAPAPSFPVPEPHQSSSVSLFSMPEPRPLPLLPGGEEHESSPFKVQGREKRQRTVSSNASVEEGDSMASFRFPVSIGFEGDSSAAATIKRAVSPSPPPHLSLNPAAESFTFAGFSAAATWPNILNPHGNGDSPEDATLLQESNKENEEIQDQDEEGFKLPSVSKPKRAPIPLDFKHPVSNNTVPAGLFKALINNGDERTRKTVRSRLSSREIFDHAHRPSLDDLDMPSISHKVSRTRLVTDPGKSGPISPVEDDDDDDDVFGPARSHARRRSSLPDNMTFSASPSDSIMSETSPIRAPPGDLTTRLELRRYEDRFEKVLDEKLLALRRDIMKGSASVQGLTPKAEEMISEVVSLFRSQLQESAARSLDDSQMDARGELDFELIKGVVERGHEKMLGLMRKELGDITSIIANKSLEVGNVSSSSTAAPTADVLHALERYNTRTINAVVEAISEMSNRLETITRNAPARDQDTTVNAIVSALNPALHSLRPEVVDYDYLTTKLSQAVKPHISQIIDLASDKRETAGLIVDSLLPLLSGMMPKSQTLDTDAIALQLTTEVRRAIAPIDAFEIKEQVADLVVERLDSRLAVRDKSFNVDTVTGKVTENVTRLVEPLNNVGITLSNLMEGQKSLATQQADLSAANQHVAEIVSELPAKVSSIVEDLKAMNAAAQSAGGPNEHLAELKLSLKEATNVQKVLVDNGSEVLQLSQELMSKMTVLPETLSSVTNTLQTAHADFMISHDVTRRELEELRRANTDYQVQVAKARGAHGQVRVEKDMLSEKLRLVEGDRDRLKAQVKEHALKAAEEASVDSKISELEDALAKALARLQSSDVATQANQDRIMELEKINKELLTEKQVLKSKVDLLEITLTFSNRDKEASERRAANLQQQYDHLASQQSNWDTLRQTSEHIQHLATLVAQGGNDEVKELRRIVDKHRFLEGEHSALRSRYKELESKAGNSDKAAAAAKQSLSQAQQRSSEWEKQSKENAAKLEITQTKLEQTEQTLSQIEADHSLLKMQVEEQEADARLVKDRENSLRVQVAELETKLSGLQHELDQAQNKYVKTPTLTHAKKATNGTAHPPRPDSRVSTVYVNISRSATPNGRPNSDRSATPPTSVWDSMHAPHPNSFYQTPTSVHAPASRYPSNLGHGTPRTSRQYTQPPVSAPSPTPSTASQVTLDEDGWYS